VAGVAGVAGVVGATRERHTADAGHAAFGWLAMSTLWLQLGQHLAQVDAGSELNLTLVKGIVARGIATHCSATQQHDAEALDLAGRPISYPSGEVSIPIRVSADAIYMRKDTDGSTVVRFVTREDRVVPSCTVVTVPVEELSASAARSIGTNMVAGVGDGIHFDLRRADLVKAAAQIAAIIKEDDERQKCLRIEKASKRLRCVR
jgi:hypothetical protein